MIALILSDRSHSLGHRQAGMSLSAVFRAVEAAKSGLRVRSYAVSQTTLEQVFLLKAREHGHEEEDEDDRRVPTTTWGGGGRY